MTRIVARNIPPRVVWQLEQRGLHPLLARLYAARGVTDKAELDYELKSLLPPCPLTHASDAAAARRRHRADGRAADRRRLRLRRRHRHRRRHARSRPSAPRSISWYPTASSSVTACRRRSSTSPRSGRPT